MFKTFVLFLSTLISISTASLQYAEAIENDGLTLCVAIDSEANDCSPSHKDDNDNDHEMSHIMFFIAISEGHKALVINQSSYTQSVHNYLNSYSFAFHPELIKPPELL
jgi:GMP synthase-like glutamine amidotransferase